MIFTQFKFIGIFFYHIDVFETNDFKEIHTQTSTQNK